MLDPIRLATPEEIERYGIVSDLVPGATPVAFGDGDRAHFAVLRTVTEIDPLISPEGDNKRKALFVWALENALRMMGVPQYYFNIRADNDEWRHISEKWGAQQVSLAPEFRFKKVL